MRLPETSGKAIAELVRDLEINDNNLYHWRGLNGRQAQNATHGSSSELESELKRENKIPRQERDIA